MTVIKVSDRQQLRKRFQALSRPVKLLLFTRDEDCEYCDETRELLTEVAALTDKVSLQTYDLRTDVQQAGEYRVDKAPAIVVMNGTDYGVRFHGIPSGYEFTSLVDAIVDVSRADSGLRPESKRALADLRAPLHFQVFVTPKCPYCPRAVRLAHQLAVESVWIRADMIEATEFPVLAEQYGVMGVPRVVINETRYFEGALPEESFVAVALRVAAEATAKKEMS